MILMHTAEKRGRLCESESLVAAWPGPSILRIDHGPIASKILGLNYSLIGLSVNTRVTINFAAVDPRQDAHVENVAIGSADVPL
jgi:hypothetical protein